MAKHPYQRYNLLDPVGNVINGVIDLTQAAAEGLSAAMRFAANQAAPLGKSLGQAAAGAGRWAARQWQNAGAAAQGAGQWVGQQAQAGANWAASQAAAARQQAGAATVWPPPPPPPAPAPPAAAAGEGAPKPWAGWRVASNAMKLGAAAFSNPVGAASAALSQIGPKGKAAGAALQLLAAAAGAAGKILPTLVSMTAKGAVNTSSTLQGSMDMLAATLVPILQPFAELASRILQSGAGSVDRMAQAGSRYANAGAMVAEMFMNRVVGIDTYGQDTKRSMAGLAAPTMTGSMEAWADQAMMQSLKLGEKSLEADMARRNLESMETLIGLVREHIQVTRQNNPPIA